MIMLIDIYEFLLVVMEFFKRLVKLSLFYFNFLVLVFLVSSCVICVLSFIFDMFCEIFVVVFMSLLMIELRDMMLCWVERGDDVIVYIISIC